MPVKTPAPTMPAERATTPAQQRRRCQRKKGNDTSATKAKMPADEGNNPSAMSAKMPVQCWQQYGYNKEDDTHAMRTNKLAQRGQRCQHKDGKDAHHLLLFCLRLCLHHLSSCPRHRLLMRHHLKLRWKLYRCLPSQRQPLQRRHRGSCCCSCLRWQSWHPYHCCYRCSTAFMTMGLRPSSSQCNSD